MIQIIILGLFLKACQAFANLGKGFVCLVVPLNKFNGDGFKVFKFVLHGCKADAQIVQGEINQANHEPTRRDCCRRRETVLVDKVSKVQPITRSNPHPLHPTPLSNRHSLDW